MEMGKTLKCVMFGLLLVVVASSVTLSQSDNHFFGTWKLNVEKSNSGTGQATGSSTFTFEDRGDGVILVTIVGNDAKGNRTSLTQFAAKYDGKDYPFLQLGAEGPMSISLNLVDAYRDDAVIKSGGKVISTAGSVISEDGKTLTHTIKSTDAEGQETSNVMVFERQ